VTKQPFRRSVNMHCSHRLVLLDQHASNYVDDPSWTAITLSLALDDPWLGAAGPQPLEPLG
jgi:hypothetical protein